MLRNHLMVIILIGLFFVEIASLVVGSGSTLPLLSEEVSVVEKPLKISEIDGPRIDESAAMVVVEEEVRTPAARSLPGELWLFLLLAYGALLVFNFSATFERVVSPQWFWELLYTLLALVSWYTLDPQGLFLWFPFLVIKLGLIIFALYVYLLEKRGVLDVEESKTEPLF